MRTCCTVHQVAEEWTSAQPSAYVVQQAQLVIVQEDFDGCIAGVRVHFFSLVVVQAFR